MPKCLIFLTFEDWLCLYGGQWEKQFLPHKVEKADDMQPKKNA
jgi:hypothetical protein